MALGFTIRDEGSMGRLRWRVVDIAFDSSYPSGGEAIGAAGLGFGRIQGMTPIGGNAAAGAYMFHWDTANNKAMVFYPTGGATAPNSVADPVVGTTIPSGATPVTSDAANPTLTSTVTPGRAKELKNATNASTLTFRVLAWGT